ncbi:hypothetical protein SALBM311S_08692 [Streptomyces alboniger]
MYWTAFDKRLYVVTGVVSELYSGLGEAVVEAEHVGGRVRLDLDGRRGSRGGLVVCRCRARESLSVSCEDLPELLGGHSHVVASADQFLASA